MCSCAQARDGTFLNNMRGHNSIINTLAANEDNVLFSGGDNGSITFWDYDTGHAFQKLTSGVQPGSLDAEAGIFASSFDNSGSRLITGEADKSIKIWREVGGAPQLLWRARSRVFAAALCLADTQSESARLYPCVPRSRRVFG
jgi:WD40 repeat protein